MPGKIVTKFLVRTDPPEGGASRPAAIPDDLTYGYGHQALSDAFDTVKDPRNWKYPIDTVTDAGADRDLITHAVIYFTGSVPVFLTEPDGLRVVADGYYAEIGS
jgi:hypothetical protein